MSGQDPQQLIGRWVHVHEEDDGRHRVFRRAGVPLPPSRGRAELDIAPDMTVRRFGPGADDRPGVQGRAHIGFAAPRGSDGDFLRAVRIDGDRLLIAKD